VCYKLVETGNQAQPQTFLIYFLVNANPCCSFAQGSGLIPNTDLAGNATSNHLSLNTNTCSNPDFTTFLTFFGSAQPLPFCGVITVNGQNDISFAEISQSFSGTQQQSFSTFTVIVNGHSKQSTAVPSGSVTGVTIEGNFLVGATGTFTQASITLQ
jgi:hypothetical protein